MKALNPKRLLQRLLRVSRDGEASNPRSRLAIGMTLDELTALLGDPTGVTRGGELWGADGTIVVVGLSDNSDALSRLRRTEYMCWKRPEADYYLNIVDGRLDKVYQVVEKPR